MTESQSKLRLSELVDTIRREHELAEQAGEALIQHALTAGEALNEAKALVPAGEWIAWLTENAPEGKGYWACQYYMRLANLKEHVDPTLSIGANLRLLAGLKVKQSQVPDDVKTHAVDLAVSGEMPLGQIARECGVHKSTVKAWVNPEWARDKEDRRAARKRPPSVSRIAKPEPDNEEHDRALIYGEPGRAALGRAVRALAHAKGRGPTRDALLDLAAIATAWALTLRDQAERDAEVAAEFAQEAAAA